MVVRSSCATNTYFHSAGTIGCVTVAIRLLGTANCSSGNAACPFSATNVSILCTNCFTPNNGVDS